MAISMTGFGRGEYKEAQRYLPGRCGDGKRERSRTPGGCHRAAAVQSGNEQRRNAGTHGGNPGDAGRDGRDGGAGRDLRWSCSGNGPGRSGSFEEEAQVR